MRIGVADLEPGQIRRFPFAETIAGPSDDAVFDRPVTGNIEVEATPRSLRLQGRLRTPAALTCGRCLAVFRQTLTAVLEEEFLLPPGPAAGGQPLGDKDVVFTLGPDLVLDVSDVIRQHLLLALPMVPLCTPGCRGLCPHCGANLNERTCECVTKPEDPRLAPFRGLKIEAEDASETER